MRILLVEDEENVANFILTSLRDERFAVDWAQDADKGAMWAKVNPYDLAIMDINLGEHGNGLEICRAIRDKGKMYPVIVLSVLSETKTKIEALNMGADDYLTKPFSGAELIARVRALLRRQPKVTGPLLKVGDLELDAIAHKVTRDNKEIGLNKKEFALLEYMMRNPGVVLTRNMILEHVWDMNADPFTNTVDVHIRFLRVKIDSGRRKKLLKTVHGFGYKLEG